MPEDGLGQAMAASKPLSTGKGTYALVLHLKRETDIRVGGLGVFRFPAGWYVYTGSARSGLRQRLARHMKKGKLLRWHIDYLREHADPVEVWYTLSEERLECRWSGCG